MINIITIELSLKLTPHQRLIMTKNISTTSVKRQKEIMEHILPKDNTILKKSIKILPRRSMILEEKSNMTGKKPQNLLISSKSIKPPLLKLKNQQLPIQKVPSLPLKSKIISQNISRLTVKKVKSLIVK